jgi:hypothetical protein
MDQELSSFTCPCNYINPLIHLSFSVCWKIGRLKPSFQSNSQSSSEVKESVEKSARDIFVAAASDFAAVGDSFGPPGTWNEMGGSLTCKVGAVASAGAGKNAPGTTVNIE